jgi:hypothetical protein
VGHTCDVSIGEAKAGRSPVGGQPELHRELLSEKKSEVNSKGGDGRRGSSSRSPALQV